MWAPFYFANHLQSDCKWDTIPTCAIGWKIEREVLGEWFWFQTTFETMIRTMSFGEKGFNQNASRKHRTPLFMTCLQLPRTPRQKKPRVWRSSLSNTQSIVGFQHFWHNTAIYGISMQFNLTNQSNWGHFPTLHKHCGTFQTIFPSPGFANLQGSKIGGCNSALGSDKLFLTVP